jgi:hypothetical protein
MCCLVGRDMKTKYLSNMTWISVVQQHEVLFQLAHQQLLLPVSPNKKMPSSNKRDPNIHSFLPVLSQLAATNTTVVVTHPLTQQHRKPPTAPERHILPKPLGKPHKHATSARNKVGSVGKWPALLEGKKEKKGSPTAWTGPDRTGNMNGGGMA